MDTEFIGLKIAGLVVALAGAAWVYGKYFAHGTSVTADTLIADAKGIVTKLEAFVASKAKEAEAKAIEVVKAQTTHEALAADAQKVRDFIEKIKAAF